MHFRLLVACFTAFSFLIGLAAQPSAPVSLAAAPLSPTASHNISDLSCEELPLTPLDPISEPADPLYNLVGLMANAPAPVVAEQHFDVETVDARHAHLVFDFLFRNDGPRDVTRLEVYVAVPSDRDNQRITQTYSAS